MWTAIKFDISDSLYLNVSITFTYKAYRGGRKARLQYFKKLPQHLMKFPANTALTNVGTILIVVLHYVGMCLWVLLTM